MMKKLSTTLLVASIAFSSGAFSAQEAKQENIKTLDQIANNYEQEMVRDGVSIKFKITPDQNQSAVMEGKYADVQFEITDAQSGEPIKGIYPAVWMDIAKPYDQKEADASATCKDRVALYMQGIVGVRPLVDLNSYFVLAMNADTTISVIDPIIGVAGITKLYASINLKGAGADWAKTDDEKFLYVTMPSEDEVAKINLNTFKVVSNFPSGSNPLRISLQPDEKYLWIANNHRDEERSGVTVVDRETEESVGFIPTGSGHHELAFSPDSKFAYISNRNAGSVSVIDINKMEKIKTLRLSDMVIDIAYSKLSESLYVTNGAAGEISVIDGVNHTVSKRIKVDVGVGPVGVSQDGRWVIAANSEEDVVYAIDVSNNAVKHTLEVGRKPYQIAFTRAFAFIRSLGTERVSGIELAHLDSLKNVPVSSFQAGPNAPGKVRDLSLASAMTQAPGEAAILVVSPSDNTVYYYMEGMNAPMGNFRNYGHPPRAVEVADRTLREDSDGVYHAKVKVPVAGTYDVAFLMESPSILHCFTMNAEIDPDIKKADIAGIEFIDSQQQAEVGETVKLRFRLTDPVNGGYKANLNDVRVRYYRAPAFDRKEVAATEVKDGIYEMDATLSKGGLYYFFVGSEQANLPFGGDHPFHSVQVKQKL